MREEEAQSTAHSDAGSVNVDENTSSDLHVDRSANPVKEKQSLVMQLVVRRDLLSQWGLGPLMAQTAHATAAVLYETREQANTIAYLNDLRNMRKVVLETPDAKSLEKLAFLLSAADPPIPHHLWLEQPQNVTTCLAFAPNQAGKDIRKALAKAHCRLWKD
ncbi:peptidyl-tRNA hydrolase II [Fistulina hepatica ATCC 64428]|uniref:peptidyl-tRNA hydrolase n=1 Tax=Fistulina hepatica ATCC 64428 TaxID=1128425 RepID=A0A0D7AFR6_9AGAR|nr:peptidyl-tRNA hydrolase II [Fistulina hepatica ATCC 64428]